MYTLFLFFFPKWQYPWRYRNPCLAGIQSFGKEKKDKYNCCSCAVKILRFCMLLNLDHVYVINFEIEKKDYTVIDSSKILATNGERSDLSCKSFTYLIHLKT